MKSKPENKKEPDLNEALDLTVKFLGTPAETWKNSDREGKIMIHGMIFDENPKYSLNTGFGTPEISLPFYIKHYIYDQKDGLVDQREKFWNTFFDIVLKWGPGLREINQDEQ